MEGGAGTAAANEAGRGTSVDRAPGTAPQLATSPVRGKRIGHVVPFVTAVAFYVPYPQPTPLLLPGELPLLLRHQYKSAVLFTSTFPNAGAHKGRVLTVMAEAHRLACPAPGSCPPEGVQEPA